MKALVWSVVAAAVLVCGLWGIWWDTPNWADLRRENPQDSFYQKSGSAGDTFGSLNALFTGLALVGLVWNLLYQNMQLKEAKKMAYNQNRAWISLRLDILTFRKVPPGPGEFKCYTTGHFENRGQSPAVNVNVNIEFVYWPISEISRRLGAHNFNHLSFENQIAFPNVERQEFNREIFFIVPENHVEKNNHAFFLIGQISYLSAGYQDSHDSRCAYTLQYFDGHWISADLPRALEVMPEKVTRGNQYFTAT